MSTNASPGDGDDLCVVCFKNVDLYSIGACDHPVCYECSTRMRVVCDRKECPICRSDMPEVVFTREVKPFKDLVLRPGISDQTYGIQFMSKAIQDDYRKLLEFVCSVCAQEFKNFNQLRDHMRKEHELHYCDLCVKHLMIFAFERRCYTRAELATHRRKGDPDNTSHRGHPICEFCDERYMDNDHLFRHLRREHLYCHFCDADGKHYFFRSYSELRDHFLEDHFLCEQGDCQNEMLTSVFRTDIDLKAHIATVHSKQMGRAASKQARTLELEFNFKSRRNQQHQNENPEVVPAVRNFQRSPIPPPEEQLPQSRRFVPSRHRPLTEEDFPSLGGNGSEASGTGARTSVTFTSKMSRPKFNTEEFPSLSGGGGGGGTAATSTGAVPRNSRNITITKTTKESRRPASTAATYSYGKGFALNKQNFPTLQAESSSGNSTVKLTVQPARPVQPSNVSIHVNHDGQSVSSSTSIQVRPKSMAEAFPALGGSSAQHMPETKQWVAPKPKKQQEPKTNKVAKAPVLPSSSLTDFPSLGRKMEKKSSSVTVPIREVADSNNKPQPKHESNNNHDNHNNHDSNTVNSTLNAKKEKNTNKKKEDIANNSGSTKAKSKDKKPDPDPTTSNNSKNKKKTKTETIEKVPEDNQPGNTLVKRTSTLNIGTLGQPSGKPLSGPPGFTSKPPPGFGFTSNDLTFTSSSGQSYSILPTETGKHNPRHSYYQPLNFQNRNIALIKRCISVLKTQESLNEFKSYSALFRSGSYAAEKYYEHCRTVLASEFDKLFPELLVLLPDIDKQQELYRVHKALGSTKNLEICATCKQIIFSNELKHHMNSHYMENHFPGLPHDAAGPDAWRK